MSNLKVMKHNDLITSKFTFSLNEYRLILYTISKINPLDKLQNNVFEVDIRELATMFNISVTSLYDELKTDIKTRLMKRLVTIESNIYKGGFNTMVFVTNFHYNDGEASLSVKFNEDAMPLLIDLKRNFTSYYIEQISHFKSTYSIRIYEWCIMRLKQNEGKPTQFFLGIQEIKERLEIEEKYKMYNNLKQRVIQKSINEINAFSDLSVRYEEIKKGRSVHQLKLIVKYKKWEKKEEQFAINFDPELKI